jgi:hypothetical protein
MAREGLEDEQTGIAKLDGETLRFLLDSGGRRWLLRGRALGQTQIEHARFRFDGKGGELHCISGTGISQGMARRRRGGQWVLATGEEEWGAEEKQQGWASQQS